MKTTALNGLMSELFRFRPPSSANKWGLEYKIWRKFQKEKKELQLWDPQSIIIQNHLGYNAVDEKEYKWKQTFESPTCHTSEFGKQTKKHTCK